MAGMLPRFPELSGVDALVPVPLHPKRLRQRGFNQAFLLAHEAASIYSKPVEEILERRRNTLPQWRLTRSRRSENLRQAFEVRPPARLGGRTFLLIDDVCTTGATLESCAQTLKAAGASRICAYVLARD
jgi:ComF family protein